MSFALTLLALIKLCAQQFCSSFKHDSSNVEAFACKVYEIQDRAGFDALTIVERPEPKPGYGQILVRVRAVSLNYHDLIILESNRAGNSRLIPTLDGAGEVLALGDGVMRVKVGDRVASTFFHDWRRFH